MTAEQYFKEIERLSIDDNPNGWYDLVNNLPEESKTQLIFDLTIWLTEEVVENDNVIPSVKKPHLTLVK